MPWPAFALLAVAVAFRTDRGDDPRAIIARANTAVLGDSAAAVSARWSARLRSDSTDRAAALGLATIARLLGDPPEAERLYGIVLTRSDDALAAAAFFGLGDVARTRGDFLTADSLLTRAAEGAAAQGDGEAEAEARAFLGIVRQRVAGTAAGLAQLDLAEALVPPGATRVRGVLHCARAELMMLTTIPGVRAEALAGADLAARSGDPRTRAACLHLVATDLRRTGRVDSALVVYEETIAERRRARDRGGLAASLQWRAWLLQSRGALGESWKDYEEAVREAEATGNVQVLAWAVAGMAGVAQRVADYASAAALTNRAESLQAALGDRYFESTSAHLRADLERLLGRTAQAREAFERSLALHQQTGYGDGIIGAAVSLAHLAMLDESWDDAERWLSVASRTAREGGMANHLGELTYHEALLDFHRGRTGRAEARWRESLARAPESRGNARFLLGARLAEIHALHGDLALAEAELTGAEDALEAWRATLTQEHLRTLAFQASVDQSDPDLGVATVLALLAANGREASAFALAERSRARMLLDQFVRAQALALSDRPGDGSDLPRTGTISAVDVSAALPDERTAVLEYVTGAGGEPTTLFVVTREGLAAHTLAPIDSFAPLIDRYVALLETDGDHRRVGRSLSEALLDPALRMLAPEISNLVVVADGAIHRLPLDPLVMPDGSHVIEQYNVTRMPSAAVAVQLWRRPTASGPARILAMADPVFPTHETELPRLKASAREARVVARFGPTTVVRGDEARESWLKGEPLGGYRVLHFATHAVVNEQTLAGTALVLGAGDGEDGFVDPGELATLDLDADLVVLSSCRTAGGVVVHGEGTLGLVAPLLAAGSRAVVATTWPISDRDPLRIVEVFYRGLADTLPAGEALRAAKVRALNDGAPVSQWAGFTLIGDPFVRVPLEQPGRNWRLGTLVGSLLLLSVGGVASGLRRRRR